MVNNENLMNGASGASSIGGLATSLMPDTNMPLGAESEKHSSAIPVISVLRRDSSLAGSSSTPTLQFESTSGLLDELEDSDDDMPRSGEKRSGRRKIKIEYIEDKSRRHITFSKRKAGIMKKAYELSTLTGTQVLLLVASETGHVYTFATPKLQPLITKQEGKNLIQACLNSPDHLQSIPSSSVSAHSHSAAHHHHSVASNLSDYLPSVNTGGSYDPDLNDDELSTGRSTSALNVAASHGYLSSGSTPTPPAGGSAAAVAAAAAQVFMNSGASSTSSANQYGNYSQASSNPGSSYWNSTGTAVSSSSGMYAPISNKSQQQQQQQQMYHALMQQQQLYQQYQQQQQQQHQQIQKQSPDSNDS